jgi:hypothetical protein
MTLRDALQAVYDSHGSLTPQLIVDEARKSKTAAGRLLRDRLEWDNAVAGEAFRRHQAQELIRSVRVCYREATDTEPERSVRGFHAVRIELGYVYEPLEKVTNDPFTQRLVLADMEREWRALKARYDHFEEFVAMVKQDLPEAA